MKNQAYQPTEEDVQNVLSSNSLSVANTNGKSFESMANEIFVNLNFELIEEQALFGDDLDEQTDYANDEIARQLREMGILEPLKETETDSLFEQYENFKIDNKVVIEILVTQLVELNEEVHWDLIEEMKDYLGAEGANDSSDREDDQDEVISDAETWVSDNCSDGGIEEDVAMALWLRGIEEGTQFLQSKQKCFYVWCDGDCQNKTSSREEAIRWRDEFKDAGRNSYVVDEDNDLVELKTEASNNNRSERPS